MADNTKPLRIGGVDYPLAWGNLAIHRFRSIPAAQRNVVGPAMLAQIVWAAYKGISHPFPSWEHAFAAIADLPEADYVTLDEAMAACLPAPEPKQEAPAATTKPAPEPTDAEKKSGSPVTAPSPADASA